MIAFFMAIPGMKRILGVAGLVLTFLAGIFIFGKSRERKGRKEGFRKENTKRNKESKNVKKRMDSVKPATSDDVDDSLSEGKF